MIREERDPAWWDAVARHPEVAQRVFLAGHIDLAPIVQNPAVTPLAAEHGGFILLPLSEQIAELHTMFTPEGWGREAALAAREMESQCLERLQALVTFETLDNWRSRPPRSHGWQPTGELEAAPGVFARYWILTRSAWRASPVFRRL